MGGQGQGVSAGWLCTSDLDCPISGAVCMGGITADLDEALLYLLEKNSTTSFANESKSYEGSEAFLDDVRSLVIGPPGCMCSQWFSLYPRGDSCDGINYGSAVYMLFLCLGNVVLLLITVRDILLLKSTMIKGHTMQLSILLFVMLFFGTVWAALNIYDPLHPRGYNSYKFDIKVSDISYFRSAILAGYISSQVVTSITIVQMWLKHASRDTMLVSQSDDKGNEKNESLRKTFVNEHKEELNILLSPLLFLIKMFKYIEAVYILTVFIICMLFTSDGAIYVSLPFSAFLIVCIMYSRFQIVNTLLRSQMLEETFLAKECQESGRPSVISHHYFAKAISAVRVNSTSMVAGYSMFILVAASYTIVSSDLIWKRPSVSPFRGVSISMVLGLSVQTVLLYISWPAFSYIHTLSSNKIRRSQARSNRRSNRVNP